MAQEGQLILCEVHELAASSFHRARRTSKADIRNSAFLGGLKSSKVSREGRPAYGAFLCCPLDEPDTCSLKWYFILFCGLKSVSMP